MRPPTKMQLLKKFWPIITLVALFAVSVILRFSSFSLDPIASAGHTPFMRFNNNEVWIHNKLVFDVYESRPIATHKFGSYIGGGAEDFLVNKKDTSLVIYTSFPSAHFAIPYVLFKALNVPLTFTSLQIFGLAIHAACIGLIYYLVWLLTRNKLMGVLGASIYLFSTATLQHHMNVYWAHQLLMPVFLAALIVFVRNKGLFKWWQGLILGFVMSLITWTGSVVVIGFSAYGAFMWWRTRNRQYASYGFMLAGMVTALSAIVAQVMWATGTNIPEYLGKVAHRAGARSASASYTTPALLGWHLVSDLILNYGGYMIIAYTLALKKRLQGFEWSVLFVASFPLLESFILLEHDTVYGFGQLKWLIPIILIVCIAGNRFATTKKRKALLVGALTLANIVHAALFFIVYVAN